MQQYWPRIKQIARGPRATRTVLFETKNGCAPIPGVERRGRGCDQFVDEGFAAAHRRDVRTVVIGASWSGFVTRTDYYRSGDTNGAPLALLTPQSGWVMDGFERAVRALVDDGKEVVIMLSAPRHDDLDPKRLITRVGLSWKARTVPAVPLRAVDAESREIDAVLRGIALRTGAAVIDPSDWLCGREFCPNVDENGRPIYMDGSHVRKSIMQERIAALDRYVYLNE